MKIFSILKKSTFFTFEKKKIKNFFSFLKKYSAPGPKKNVFEKKNVLKKKYYVQKNWIFLHIFFFNTFFFSNKFCFGGGLRLTPKNIQGLDIFLGLVDPSRNRLSLTASLQCFTCKGSHTFWLSTFCLSTLCVHTVGGLVSKALPQKNICIYIFFSNFKSWMNA